MSEPVDFHCHVCGTETDTAPNLPERAVCEEHCGDHDYQHDPYRRGKFCVHCDRIQPFDWDED